MGRVDVNSITDEKANVDKIIVKLAIPTILESLSRIVVNYFDAAMVGGLGAYATAAVGINSSTHVMLTGILMAFGVGFSVLAAMAVGAGDFAKSRRISQQAILVTFVFGLLISLLMQIIGQYSPIWLGAEPDVIPSAISYIRIVAGASVFQALTVAAAGLLRGIGNTRVPFLVNLVANVVNIIGNFLLIPETRTLTLFNKWSFVMWGADLKVTGAAIATAVSIAFSAAGMLLYLHFKDTPVKLDLKGFWFFDKKMFKDSVVISAPIALERFVLASGQLILTKMVAHFGTNATASHYIVNTVSTLAYETSMGFSTAATTLVAQCVGAIKRELSYRYMKHSLYVGIIISTVLSVVVFIIAPTIVGFFNKELAVVTLSTFIVRMDSVSEPMFGISTVLCGAFRGYGDTRYPFIVSFIGIIITRLIFGYIFGYILNMGLLGIWIGIFIDIVIRAIICLVHMRKYKVPPVVTPVIS